VWFLDTDEWLRVFAWGWLAVGPENRWICGERMESGSRRRQ
jgi:hypothetical protein